MQVRLHEVAHLFDVPESVVHTWIRDEGLPARVNNSQYRINCAELIEWATLARITIPEPLLEKVGSPAPLGEALELGGVHYGISGGDRETVFSQVVSRLPLLEQVEREEIRALMLARECGQSTAIGDGIAIPHPSRPIVLSVRQPMVALCLFEKGLDWATPDKKPLRAMFLVVAPNSRTHLYLLGQLSTALRDSQFRSAIHSQVPAPDILELARGLSAPAMREVALA